MKEEEENEASLRWGEIGPDHLSLPKCKIKVFGTNFGFDGFRLC